LSTVAAERRVRMPEYWLALSAVCLVRVFYYGISAAAVIGLAAVTAVLTDFFCLFLQNRSYKKVDLLHIASAIIMTLMFPASIPYHIVILSTVFAVAVGIHVFGSRGNYLFPPAAVGYLFALTCWKEALLVFPQAGEPLALFGNTDIVLHQSLSSVFHAEGLLQIDLLDLLIGAVYGPMGTGCILLLAIILVLLLLRRTISYWACLGFLFGITSLSMFSTTPMWQYLSVNMVLFSMIFLVGDMFAMPKGRISALFGSMLTGMLTFYLMTKQGLEYAAVISVMLTCPIRYAFAEIEERIGKKLDAMELAAKQKAAQNMENTANTEVSAEETEEEHETE